MKQDAPDYNDKCLSQSINEIICDLITIMRIRMNHCIYHQLKLKIIAICSKASDRLLIYSLISQDTILSKHNLDN